MYHSKQSFCLQNLSAPVPIHDCFHRLVLIKSNINLIIIIIDNFCIALFSGVPKLTALSNTLYMASTIVYKVQWLSCLPLLCCISPWYNRTGWLGVKHQLTYLLCCMHQSYKIYLFRMPGQRMQSTSWITSTGVWRKSHRSTSPPPLTQLLKQLLRWFIRAFDHGHMTAVSMMSCYGSRQTVTSSSSSIWSCHVGFKLAPFSLIWFWTDTSHLTDNEYSSHLQ